MTEEIRMSVVHVLLIVLLVLLLVGTVPAWPYAATWGYGPSGVVTLILIVLLILLVAGKL